MSKLLDGYPTCKDVIAYTEIILCEGADGEGACWKLLTSKNLSPDRILSLIQLVITDAIECAKDREDYDIIPMLNDALAQLSLPEYKQYLGAKLGLM